MKNDIYTKGGNMKKLCFTLCTLLLLSGTNLFATDYYIVSNAGSGVVNGTYVEDGQYFGKPEYAFGNYRIRFDNNEWAIMKPSDYGDDIYYTNPATSGTPPLTGWEQGADGDLPVPDVTKPMVLEYNTNLSAGTTIELPLYGNTVNVTVDWGDGNTDTYFSYGKKSHTYGSDGTYTVTIDGSLSQFGSQGACTGVEALTKVISFGDIGLTKLYYAFHSATNLSEIPPTLPASVTSLQGCFYGTDAVSFPNLNNWNFSNVTNMGGMFWNNANFNQDISGWDVSNVTSMGSMFRDATSFNQDISGWDVSNVTSFFGVFWDAESFNQDISGWDVSAATNMKYMFSETDNFNQDISGWDVGNVTNFEQMFYAASFNQDIGNWDVSSATNMFAMFWDASNFDQDLSGWDISNVTTMTAMFSSITLSTANYDAILNGWAAQSVQSNVSFSGGNSQYSSSSAAARQSLIDDDGWNITDGGPAPEFIWDGSDDEKWNNANNWAGNEVPTIDAEVTITTDGASPEINASGGGGSCFSLTVNNGATLTINDGATLLTEGGITNNGTININKTFTDDQWNLVSIPVTSATANSFLGDYLQYWDEPNRQWVEITDETTPLTPVQGYSLWPPSGKSSYTFSGTPNTGEQSIEINYTGGTSNYDGANLVGNPYPSYIDWSVASSSDIYGYYGSKYTWNGSAYEAYTAVEGYGTGSQYVEPMEGFFIVVNTDNTFSLDNSARCHAPVPSKSGEKANLENGLILFGSNGNYEDELWLVFNEQASANFELQRDAWKLLSSTEGLSQLWSVSTDGKLSIDVRPETETIQLGFANDQPGVYSIGIDEIADIPEVYLEDTKTGEFHNLYPDNYPGGDYEFTWNPEMDDENRFKLHLNSVGIEETPGKESDIMIYAANQQIFIKGAAEGKMLVSDLTGRIVLQQDIMSQASIAIPARLPAGVYMVSVQSEQDVKTQKVFIR